MRRSLLPLVGLVPTVGVIVSLSLAARPAASDPTQPRYTKDGDLIRPTGYRTWVFVGASLGMGYNKKEYEKGTGPFHNIYIDPSAYRQYVEHGAFPDKTMLIMEVLEPEANASINRRGHFEGKRTAIEVAVKDREQFDEGWAYFDFSGDGKKLAATAKAFPKARCYDCHAEHADDDNVFVQFYPVLRDIKAERSEK
jgi:hypothetical protein